jgi:hypothetical protein
MGTIIAHPDFATKRKRNFSERSKKPTKPPSGSGLLQFVGTVLAERVAGQGGRVEQDKHSGEHITAGRTAPATRQLRKRERQIGEHANARR